MEDIELYKKIEEWINKGKKCTFISIVETKGSTPRKIGAKMSINEDGEMIGTVGGGFAENKIKKVALSLIKSLSKNTEIIEVDLHNSPDGCQDVCGGKVKVLIEKII